MPSRTSRSIARWHGVCMSGPRRSPRKSTAAHGLIDDETFQKLLGDDDEA